MLFLFLSLAYTIIGVGITSLFAEPRFSLKKALFILSIFTIILIIFDIVLYILLERDLFMKLYPFTNHLPTLIITGYISKTRGWKLLFQFLSSVLFCFLIQHIGVFMYIISGKKLWGLILGYCITSFIVLWCFIKYLRPKYLRTINYINKGWLLLCIPLIIYYLAVFFIITDIVGESFLGTVIKPVLTFISAGTYAIIIFLFSSIQKEMESRHNSELFTLQISELNNHINALQSSEEAIRIEKHDLRHRLNTIASLINEGNCEEAFSYIGMAKKKLEEVEPKRWCKDPTLNAMFSVYFNQAQQHQIQIDATLAFPDELPVDSASLSVIFANAIENAIHSCEKLPPEQRKILCKAINYPKLMIKITNPCAEPILMNKEGFPTASMDGLHGIGLQSIRNFCKKNNAICSCFCKEGWFSLQITF